MIHEWRHWIGYTEVPEISGISGNTEISQAETINDQSHLLISFLLFRKCPVLGLKHEKLEKSKEGYENEQPRRGSHDTLLVRSLHFLHFHHMSLLHRHDHLAFNLIKKQQLFSLVILAEIFSGLT